MTGDRVVLLRADGSRTKGLGHLYRARTLIEALEARGHAAVAVTADDEAVFGVLDSQRVERFAPGGAAAALARARRGRRVAAVVHDTLATTDDELAAVRAATDAPLVCVDDVGAGLARADVVVNPIAFHWGAYDRAAVRARLLEGPAYMVLSPRVRALAEARPSIREAGPPRVLVAFGGTDDRELTARAITALAAVPGPLDVRVNLGPAAVRGPALEEAVRRSPHPVKIMQAVPSLVDEIAAVDVAVAAGGVMLYELAALGVPAVCVAAEAHETRSIAYWAERGFVEAAGSFDAFDEHRLAAGVARLVTDAPVWATRSAAGQSAVDGRGVDRMVALVEELAA